MTDVKHHVESQRIVNNKGLRGDDITTHVEHVSITPAIPDSPSSNPKPLKLPPSINQAQFDAYIQRAAKICGLENVTVISSAAHLDREHYTDPSKSHDMFHILEKEYFITSATIAPRGVAEVQEIVKLSNTFLMPLWPFSVGRNIGYGGAGPRVPGSIGLDMGRHMNKVLKVDVEGAYALVEPGVTFADLHNYLVENNLRDKLWGQFMLFEIMFAYADLF
jgi:hypothetical protein